MFAIVCNTLKKILNIGFVKKKFPENKLWRKNSRGEGAAVSAGELIFSKNVHPSPHMSHVICHISHVTSHMSHCVFFYKVLVN